MNQKTINTDEISVTCINGFKVDQDELNLYIETIAYCKELDASCKKFAADFLCKDERTTLILPSGDLIRLKEKAAHKGLPYETFITSVLHEYLAGNLIEVADSDIIR